VTGECGRAQEHCLYSALVAKRVFLRVFRAPQSFLLTFLDIRTASTHAVIHLCHEMAQLASPVSMRRSQKVLRRLHDRVFSFVARSWLNIPADWENAVSSTVCHQTAYLPARRAVQFSEALYMCTCSIISYGCDFTSLHAAELHLMQPIPEDKISLSIKIIGVELSSAKAVHTKFARPRTPMQQCWRWQPRTDRSVEVCRTFRRGVDHVA